MKAAPLLAASAAAFALLAGCGQGAETSGEAIEAGNIYLAGRDPPLGVDGWTIASIDMGDRWRLTYDLPGSTGGRIRLIVNKRSGDVVHMEAEQ